VRGLSCAVEAENRKIVIDPGVALGYRRHGLLPHLALVAVGEQVRRRILAALRDATDVVMSHFHGDHVPLPDPNPYQLEARQVAPLCRRARLWTKGPQGLSDGMWRRRESLGEMLGGSLPNAEGRADGPMAFSAAVPHGERHGQPVTVMMTRIASGGTVFVHASDVQLLDAGTVSLILDWRPDIALVGGPPLYLAWLSSTRRETAWQNALRLARHVCSRRDAGNCTRRSRCPKAGTTPTPAATPTRAAIGTTCPRRPRRRPHPHPRCAPRPPPREAHGRHARRRCSPPRPRWRRTCPDSRPGWSSDETPSGATGPREPPRVEPRQWQAHRRHSRAPCLRRSGNGCRRRRRSRGLGK
jgi:predicted metallo-beta-lactamase superfamily hydrolase